MGDIMLLTPRQQVLPAHVHKKKKKKKKKKMEDWRCPQALSASNSLLDIKAGSLMPADYSLRSISLSPGKKQMVKLPQIYLQKQQTEKDWKDRHNFKKDKQKKIEKRDRLTNWQTDC